MAATREPIDLSQLPPTDIRLTRLDDIYRTLREYAVARRFELDRIRYAPEDFVQDVVLNLFRRKGFGSTYDPTRHQNSSFEAVIRACGWRQIIDRLRSIVAAKTRQDINGKPFQFTSYDAPINQSEDELFSLADVIGGEQTNESLISELEDQVPADRISPNYSLTWKDLFLRSTNSTAKEIASAFGISESRISQLQQQLLIRYLKPKPVRPQVLTTAADVLETWQITSYADYLVVRQSLPADKRLQLEQLIDKMQSDPTLPQTLRRQPVAHGDS